METTATLCRAVIFVGGGDCILQNIGANLKYCRYFAIFVPMSSDASFGLKLFLAVFRPVQRLPLKFHYFWGRVFSWVCRKLLHYREDVVMVNLARSFPEKKYKELKEIAKGFYAHIGEIFAEAMWFGGCHNRPGKLNKSCLVDIDNPDELMEAFATAPSVMVLDSHFGNWELMGGFFQYFHGYPQEKITVREEDICVVYKELSSKFSDGFFKANRCAALKPGFAGYTESKKVLRYAVEHRREKKLYIFPTDQFPYKGATRHEVPSFMNQPTQVMCGGAALANKFGMAVFSVCMERMERGRYKMKFTKICDDASSMAPERIMEQYYAVLEEEIRRTPANYLWSHKRWK